MSAYAQKVHQIELTPTDINLEIDEFYFVQVIDNRANKENIGFVRKGISNRNVLANFEKDFSFHILSTLSQILVPARDKEQLILRIDKLNISETASTYVEVAECVLGFDVLRSSDNGFEILGSYEVVEKAEGLEVTSTHPLLICTAISKGITAFKEGRLSNADFVKISENQLVDTISINSEEIGNFADSLPRGLYQNAWELASGQPSLKNQFYVKKFEIGQGKKQILHYLVFDKSTNKKIKGLYAFSINGEIYLNANQYNVGNYFVKETGNGAFITFEDRFSPPSAAVAAGLIGAAMSNRRRLVAIEKKTGLVNIYGENRISKLLLNFPEIEVKWNKSKKDFAAICAVMRLVNKAIASGN